MLRKNTVNSFVVEFVRDNPGCLTKDIQDAAPQGTKSSTISSTLRRLREEDVIQRKSEGWVCRGNPARWYPVDYEVDNDYMALAQDILQNIQTLNPAARQQYLAMRLKDLKS